MIGSNIVIYTVFRMSKETRDSDLSYFTRWILIKTQSAKNLKSQTGNCIDKASDNTSSGIRETWHRDILQRTTRKLNWIRGCRGRVYFVLESSTNKVWRGEEIRTLNQFCNYEKREINKHVWTFFLRCFPLLDIPVPCQNGEIF